MARHPDWHGGPGGGGWYVCDIQDMTDNRGNPIHEEPCANREEAEEIAAMMNDENDGWNNYPWRS